jgi:hypothetical protein
MAITISGSGITSANIADGTIVNADINSSAAIDGTKVSGSFGKVLQVVSVIKNSSFSTASTSFTNVTGLSATITPSSTSSKILILGHITISTLTGAWHTWFYNMTENGSAITNGTTPTPGALGGGNGYYAGYSTHSQGVNELRSPNTTSALTYNFQIKAGTSYGGNVYVNTTGSGATYQGNGTSTITLMEIAG